METKSSQGKRSRGRRHATKIPARTHGEPGGMNEGWRRGGRARLESGDEVLRALPPLVRPIRGQVGNVVFKTYGRKIVRTRVPCFDGYVPSAAQRVRRARLRVATAFAKRVYAVPAAKAVYMAAARKLGPTGVSAGGGGFPAVTAGRSAGADASLRRRRR